MVERVRSKAANRPLTWGAGHRSVVKRPRPKGSLIVIVNSNWLLLIVVYTNNGLNEMKWNFLDLIKSHVDNIDKIIN